MERDLISNSVAEEWEKDIPRRVRKFGVQEAAKNAKMAKERNGELAMQMFDMLQEYVNQSSCNGNYDSLVFPVPFMQSLEQ